MTNRWSKSTSTIAAFLLLLAYFLLFARQAVHAHFAPDDMMNIAGYWKRGFWLTVLDNLRFWSAAYRPLGGVYYLPLYHLFGLNPLPYRIVALTFVLAGSWLSYLVAVPLTKSRAISLVAGIICCAHATMVDVYYSPSTIYDVLARFFSLLLLFLYIRIRDAGAVPTTRQTVLILLLFAAALDAKEISVMFAVAVLGYEIIYHGWPKSRAWLTREGLVPSLMILIAVAYTAGKMLGANPLANADAYKMVFSLDRYLDNNVVYSGSVFYTYFINTRGSLIAADIALLLLFSHRLPVVRWCALFILTITLPISFISTRGGSSLLIPLFGWAVLLPTLIASIWTPEWKYSKWAVNISLALFCLLFVQRTIRYWQPQISMHLEPQEKTWKVIAQLRDLHFQPKPGSSVLIINDPWPHDWDMFFISELAWDDPSVQITLASKQPAPPDPAKYDAVLEFTPSGDLTRIH